MRTVFTPQRVNQAPQTELCARCNAPLWLVLLTEVPWPGGVYHASQASQNWLRSWEWNTTCEMSATATLPEWQMGGGGAEPIFGGHLGNCS